MTELTKPLTFIIATSNPGKLKEMQAHLTDLPIDLQLKPASLEIEETGTTFSENAGLKASQVAQALGEWAIADDSGLAVDQLGGMPGVYSARYADSDQARIEKLLKELGNSQDRQAQFICAIALANPQGEIVLAVEGICPGEISFAPKGDNGFGYDPIFFVPEVNLTFAEMSPEIKRSLSHRGKAFQLFLPKLKELLDYCND